MSFSHCLPPTAGKTHKIKHNSHILDSLSFVSVQDLFNAPAAEQEVKTLFQRLDDPIGNVASQQVLTMAKSICQVSQILAQWARHSLRQGALRMHLVLISHWTLEAMSEKTGKKVAKGSGGFRSILRDKVPQCDAVKCLREHKMCDFSYPLGNCCKSTHTHSLSDLSPLSASVISSSGTYRWTMHFLLFSGIILYNR